MYLSSTRGACGASLLPIPASHRENSPIGCWVAVYLDGRRIYQHGDDEVPDMERFETREWEAIEYCAGPSQTPAELNITGNGCGVLMLCSRQR